MSKKLIGLLSLMAIAGIFLVPLIVSAQPSPPPVILTPTATDPPNINPLAMLAVIIRWLFGFLIVVVVLMCIIAAYMFVTAGGNPEQVTKARNWLVYALIGLAIGVLARGLVGLVLRILWEAATT